MKKMIVLWAILLLCVAFPLLAADGPSANGSFEYAAANGLLEFEFNARLQNNGSTQGEITVIGDVDLADQDVDGEGNGSGAGVVDLSLTARVDCLVLNGNRATFSGEVTQSNIGAYVGRIVLMVVEDGGEGKNAAPDSFTWGFYGSPSLTWIPSDAELVSDPGVGLFWIATDAEREDDVGIPSNASTIVDCHKFPAVSYVLDPLPHGAGNIQVKP